MTPHLASALSQSTDTGFALALAVVVALVYLLILRLIDLNEKEPAWALLLVLIVGALGALVLETIVHARTLHGTILLASVADEVTIFISLAVGVGLLEAVGKLRGWSEVNGPIDGIVYGAAAGLGFATGEAFIQQLHRNVSALTAFGLNGPFHALWPLLLFGLAAGLFGGVIGAAFGWAVDRGPNGWLTLPSAGLLVAFGLQVGYLALARADDLAGSGAVAREWIAIAVPAIFFIVLLGLGLRLERGIITSELSADPIAATPDELRLLTNHAARRAAYLRRLMAGDAHGWIGLRSLQNRQVQLALTRRRAERATDPARRAALEAEVAYLRAAVEASRHHLQTGPGGSPVPQPQA